MRRASALLVATGLAFASCGPPTAPAPTTVGGSPSSPPGSLVPSPIGTRPFASDAVATQTARPPATNGPTGVPTTLVDNLFDRVETGEWSLAEGLIATLEYLNGEREATDVTSATELLDFELTPILEAAERYLEANLDTPEAIRIRELYRDFVPTTDQLRELSSGPELVAARAGAGLRVAQVDCSEVWRHPEGPSPGLPCLEIDDFTLPGGRGRVYTPVGTIEGPDGDRLVRLATEALQASWDEYLGLGTMPPNVDVVFDPRGRRTASAGATLSEPGDCLMIVYPAWLVETEENARFILAHEAFHCFQHWLPGPEQAPEGRLWWGEGSANYFANVVYPDVNKEYVFLEMLREREPNRSLLRLSYDAFPFFQHMGNEMGNGPVIDLVAHLTLASSAAAFPGMADLFHGYGEDLLTDRIIDSSGEPIPIDAQAQNYGRFRPTAVGPIVEVDPKPFVIERLMIDWDEDREFDLDVQQTGNLLISAQPYHDGAWGPLPDPVRTCDAGFAHRVAVTRVDPVGDATVRLDLTQLETVDTCPVQITVHGAIEAVFSGGHCYVDDGFLHVTAGFGLSEDDVKQIGPYPRGYGFILGTATPGSEEPGHPDVTITDNEGHFTDLGSNASLVKSADLLTGTFSSDDIYGDYSCPFLTPPDQLPGG